MPATRSGFEASVQIKPKAPQWLFLTLALAGLYNIIWGSLAVFFPNFMFELMGMDLPRYPELWQCIGMIVGVYGVGYAIAATNPLQHWPISWWAF